MPVNKYKNNFIESQYFNSVLKEKCGGRLVEIMAVYGDAYSFKNMHANTREPLMFPIPGCKMSELEVSCDMSFTGAGSSAKRFFVSTIFSSNIFIINFFRRKTLR